MVFEAERTRSVVGPSLSGVYTSNLFNDLDFYLGPILSLYKAKYLIDPTCRLCLQANETLHHLMTDCEATSSLQLEINEK